MAKQEYRTNTTKYGLEHLPGIREVVGHVTMSNNLDKVKRKHTVNPLDKPLITQCLNT